MKDKVIIVGHGASGKDYLSDYLVNESFIKNISYTTRPIRENEVAGQTYHYITVEDFKDKIETNYWHEYNVFVNDWYYGSSKEEFIKSNLFIKEPNGVSLLSKQERNRCYIIYVNIDENIRRDRLSLRNDTDSIERRLEGDRKDFKDFKDYDLMITNSYFTGETLLFMIMNKTNIKALSTNKIKEMLKHNVYLKYTEDSKDYISFSEFIKKIRNDNNFSNIYNNMYNTEKTLYLQQ